MNFKPEDYPDQADQHFSAQEAKRFFEALEKHEIAEIDTQFQSFVSSAESKIDTFFTSILGETLSDEVKTQVEGARSSMKEECSKIKKWFSDRIAEMQSQPKDDLASKMNAFKDEFLVKWGDFKKLIAEKTKSVRNLVPGTKKPGIDAEAIILKAQDTVQNVILPKLKSFYAMSKAAAAGAIKGVKDMQKKDDSEKK